MPCARLLFEALGAKPDEHHDRVGTERGMSQIGGWLLGGSRVSPARRLLGVDEHVSGIASSGQWHT